MILILKYMCLCTCTLKANMWVCVFSRKWAFLWGCCKFYNRMHFFKSMLSFNNALQKHKHFSSRKHGGQWGTHGCFTNKHFLWVPFSLALKWMCQIKCVSDVESKSGMRGQKGFFIYSITRTFNTHFKDFTIPLCLFMFLSVLLMRSGWTFIYSHFISVTLF